MKKILFGFACSIYSILAAAQPGCPQVNAGADQTLPCGTNCTNISATYFDAGSTNSYTVASVPYAPFSYTAGTAVIVGSDDIYASSVNLPFNFCFFGTTYNQVIIGANGLISFNTAYSGAYCPYGLTGYPSGSAIPSASLPVASIMGPYQDIDPSCGGTIKWQVSGTSPCRTFVVSWNTVPMYNGACFGIYSQCVGLSCTSQIVLYETTNVIEINIANKQSCPSAGTGWNNGWAIEGIQDATGTIAYPVAGRNNTVWNTTNNSYRFTPSGTSIVSVNWSGPSVNSTVTGDPTQVYTINVCPPASTTSTYTATATYSRCDGTTVVKTDAMNITTSATPNAGPDQNLGCYAAGLTTNMAATAVAGASWTASSANPSPTTITTPSSATSAISGFTAAGTYAYLWGSGACKDSVYIVISSPANAGPGKTVACAVLPGGSATMGATTPTGTWTAQAGNPGTATITTPSSPTTTITNFSAPGVYTFVWGTAPCTSTTTVTVTAQPVAGANQTVTCATLPGGTATMAGSGTGTWSAQAGNPGTATITTASSPTTTITGFTAASVYTFVWANGACSSTATVTVTQQPNAGANQVVSCAVLPGGSATMAATTATGIWSAQAGNPGTATITTPSSPTSTITGFTAAGVYTFVWTNGACTSTATVTMTAQPVAGPNQTVTCATLPGGTATMAGSGTGTWTAQAGNPGTATITTASSPTTTITGFTAPGVYTFNFANGACTSSATVTVTAQPNAGANQTITCATLPGGTATMAATTPTGTWSAQAGNPGTATITTTSSPTTTITGFTAAGVYTFVWTNGTCSSTATVTVTAQPNAGANQTVTCATLPGGTATMAATTATGTWSAQAGNPGTATITTTSSPTTTITGFTAAGVYTFVWTNGACTSTATVTVTAQPNAGANQTITCATLPGGTATMAATTSPGVWSAQAGNPGTATITTTSSPTTTITGFTAAGVYTFVWTNGACTSTATVTVTAQPNAGANQTITCATLPGGTATMAATTPTGTWSAQAGNPGTATITTTSSPSTTITGFTAAGVYTFVWTNGSCSSTATVTVTAQPNAGAPQTVTCATLPGGTATMAATTSPGVWSAQAGNPGTANITTTTSPTTTITGFTAAGVYTFVWTNGACTSTTTVTVTAQPNAGANQNVTCATLPGGTATMAATTTPGVWSAQAGNPGTATITATSSPTTTITGFTAAGVYTFVWTNGACSSTATVTVTAQPNAGANQIVNCAVLPGGTATMAATTPTGIWSAQAGNPGTAAITAPTSPTTTITTFTAPGVYTFIWADGACTSTATVTISSLPNAGPDQPVACATLPGGLAVMAATAMSGATWTAQAGNPGTATITTPSSATTSITNFSAPGTYTFTWSNGACSDNAQIVVTAQSAAGLPQTVNCVTLPGGTATMAGTGIGTWTAQAGNPGTATITTASSPTSTITNFSAAGVYTFLYSNGTCTSSTTVTVVSQPVAGPNQNVTCAILPGGTATMAGSGTGTWTAQAGNPGTATITNSSSPTTTITNFSVAGTYTFVLTNGTCTSTATVTVTEQPVAGPNQTASCAILPGGSATMAGSGNGTWSAQAGNPGTATITTASSPTTTITNFSAAGVYTFVYANGACSSTATVTVTAQPNAGAAQIVSCITLPGGTATMAALTPTGIWSAQAGNPGTANIANASSPTSAVSNFSADGIYTLNWTNGSCVSTTTITVTSNPNSGPDQVICQYTGTSMAAVGAGTGSWTAVGGNPSATVIATPSSQTTSITGFDVAGAYRFAWTLTSGCADTMTVNVTAKPDAGFDQTICQFTDATMAATGTGSWSTPAGNPATTNITSSNSATTTITGFTQPGAYTYIWTVNGCTDTTIVNVTQKPDAGFDQTICQFTDALMAAQGAGSWTDLNTNPVVATINNANSATTTITGFTSPGAYSFVWTSNGCTDTTIVNVTAKPDAGFDQTICQFTDATMAATGAGSWTEISTNPSATTINNPTSAATTITGFDMPGAYSFVWTVNGCTDTTVVNVTQKPDAGGDLTACVNSTATMAATGAGNWTDLNTNPSTATITNPSQSNTTVTDLTVAGTYSFVWTVNGCTDTMDIVVTALPVAAVGTVNSICTANNGMAIATAAGARPFTYDWNPGTTDTLRGLAPGPYTVTVTDINNCTGSATGVVGLDNPTIPINLVSIHDLKCNNDHTGAISINAVDSGTLGYLWDNGAGNTADVSGLAANTYTVIVTDQFGCTGTAQYTVNEPLVLTVSAPTATNPSCPGSTDGKASVTAQGGSGAYHYSWDSNPVQNTQQATGLSQNTYNVTVTDDSSCTATASVTLTDPTPITFGPSVTTDAHCFGNRDGTAEVFPQGGTGSYTYQWSDSAQQTVNPATGLQANRYTVVVTDANGCTASTGVVISQPQAVLVTLVHTDLTCFQNNSGTATATASGGVPPYHYLWNNTDSTATITSLRATTYTVTASDNGGCTATGSTTLNQPDPVQLSLSSTITTCAATVDGTVTASSQGGSGPMSYALKDITYSTIQSNTTGLFTGLGAGLYTVVVTDQNGCSNADTITVQRAPFDVYTAISDSISCFGPQYTDGAIHLQGLTAVNGPFQFSLDGGALQFTLDFYDLAAGPHTVHAVDGHGCDTSFIVIVGEPVPASVDILPGDSTLTLGTSLQLSTAFRPYNTDSIKGYAWSPAEGLSCIDCPDPVVSPYNSQNTYTLTVTYNKGCLAVTTIHINVQGDPPVYVPNAFTPNGDGVNDVFYVYGEGIKTLRLTVFNRWGEKVFEADNQSTGWDGTFKGTNQPPGAYVYVVDLIYLNERKRVEEGTVTLIR